MAETHSGSVVNPVHSVPMDVVDALAAVRDRDWAVVEREHEFARLARPTEEERKAIAKHMGGDRAKPGLRDIGAKSAERLSTFDFPIGFVPALNPVAPAPVAPRIADPSFWWARTDWQVPSFYHADWRSDGLHFSGKFTYDSNPLFPFSFGFVAAFELQWERLPSSPSGRWRSAPSVELFGGLLGWTGPYDIFGGDSWCKVWLIRRQTLFQWAFGPTGPVQRVVGQAIDPLQVIDLANCHCDRRLPLGGSFPMPAVEFGDLAPQSVWAQLEVRFDVQLEGNSFLWFDPELVARTPQWPATVI